MIINRNFTNKKFFMNFSKTTFYRNASSAIVNETDKCIKINWSTLANVIPNAYVSTVTICMLIMPQPIAILDLIENICPDISQHGFILKILTRWFILMCLILIM